jgi:hypothetical protein
MVRDLLGFPARTGVDVSRCDNHLNQNQPPRKQYMLNHAVRLSGCYGLDSLPELFDRSNPILVLWVPSPICSTMVLRSVIRSRKLLTQIQRRVFSTGLYSADCTLEEQAERPPDMQPIPIFVRVVSESHELIPFARNDLRAEMMR